MSKSSPKGMKAIICSCNNTIKLVESSKAFEKSLKVNGKQLPCEMVPDLCKSVDKLYGNNIILACSEHELGHYIVDKEFSAGFIDLKRLDKTNYDDTHKMEILNSLISTAIIDLKDGMKRPLRKIEVPKEVLIIGSGLSAMETAEQISRDTNINVTVISKGELASTTLTKMISADIDLEKYLNTLKNKLVERKNVKKLPNIVSIEKTGHLGNFTVKTISVNDKEEIVTAGIVVFTGDFKEYDVSKLGNVPIIDGKKTCTWSNFDPSGLKKGSKVLVVSCVGSRSEERSYCSSYCCEMMVKKSSELVKDLDVTVLHKGIRTLGTSELDYLEARNRGVKFIQGSFTLAEKLGESFVMTTENTLLQQQVELHPDVIVFSSALLPPDEACFLDDFGLRRLENGFIDPLYTKLQTERTAIPGVLIANSMVGPSLIDELIDSSKSLALEIFKFLNTKITKRQLATTVNEDLCTGCEICIKNCPAAAIELNNDDKAVVNQNSCILCGLCTTACPSGAITVENRETKLLDEKIQVISEIHGVKRNKDPLIFLMACSECGQAAVNMISELEETIPPVIPVTVMCGSNISLTSLLKCFEKGASGVVIAVCQHCHKGKGHDVACGVADIASQVLDHARIGGWRIKICKTYANQPDILVSALQELEGQISIGGR